MGTQDGTQTDAGATPGTTTAETPQTFTQEQVEKMVRDAQTAVKADVGRMKAEADKALKAAQAAQQRLLQFQKEQEEAELDAARDEPDRLTAIRARQAKRQAEAELAQTREALNEANTKLTEISQREAEANKLKVAHDVATRLNVDPARLAKMAKFTDGSVEAIEDLAKDLPKSGNLAPNLNPDSNRSQGGASQTVTDVRRDYATGKINAVQYETKMKALGCQP